MRFHVRILMTIEFAAIVIEIGEQLQSTRTVFQVSLLHARKIVAEAILRTKCSTKAVTLWQLGANADDRLDGGIILGTRICNDFNILDVL